jgi:type VI protein secretion system component VasF
MIPIPGILLSLSIAAAKATVNGPEVHPPGRILPVWVLLILALLLLVAYYIKKHSDRQR